jgi:FkbM family methyltransferase
MNIIVMPGDENPAADALNGVYEKHYQMKPGDFVLDLGAHAGYFTQVALSKVGPTGYVLAFEPHPVNYAKWLKNCSAFSNVGCVNAMAWDENTTVDLWQSVDNSGGHSHVRVGAGQYDIPLKCPALDIGRYLRSHPPTVPNFIKIDTELSEARIIRSLMTWGILAPELAAEIHNQQMWDECRADLGAAGYKMMPDTFTNYYLYAWL